MPQDGAASQLKGNAVYYTDEYIKAICNIRNPKDKDFIEGYGYYDENLLVKGWYDYVYGGMYDYAANVDSIRGTKYALGEHFGYNQLKDTKGVYNVYLETDTTLYEFALEAYLRKYDHKEDYYKNIDNKEWREKSNREKQLYQYFNYDIQNGNFKDFSEVELKLLEYEKYSKTFEINPNYKCMDCYFVNYDRFLRKSLKNLWNGQCFAIKIAHFFVVFT